MTSVLRAPRSACVAFVLLLLAPAAALAEDAAAPKPAATHPGACHADVQRLCADAMGKPGGVADCLRSHVDELAPECRSQLQQLSHMRQRAERFRGACSEDLEKLCSDTKPGQGRLMQCLRAHESELAPACKEALPALRTGAPQAKPKP